eukprot:XP_014058107.1 PREDICTED: uncharacterized protein LOC106606433 isoform X3 [Salmo salar]
MWISVCLISSFLHSTAGCTLSVTNYDEITVYSGQSVLLTCSCTEPQAKPPSVTWTRLNQQHEILTKPSQDSLYRDRVKMFNNNSPGNLSVLLSHVTEDDVGWYRCGISHAYRDIKLTVKDSTTFLIPTTSPKGADTLGTSGEDPSASPQQNNTIQYILLAVLPVILIIAGVALYIYKRNKGKKNTEEKSSGGKTEGEKKDDPSVMYDTVQEPRNNNQEETTTPLSAPEDPSVTYSTIVHMKGKRNAVVSLERGGETEYATIKTGTFS